MNHAEEAEKNLKIADYMLTMTYPLIKDPKMLLGVLERIHKAYYQAMLHVLEKERKYKRIPPYNETFESVFNTFKQRIVPKKNIDLEIIRTIAELRELIIEHKKAPVEFTRKNKYIIADEDYKLRTIDEKKLKKHLEKAKKAIPQIMMP